MPEFHLDTSGRVDHVHPGNGRTYQVDWPELDAFTQGYIEALFFTDASDSDDELYGKGFSDLAPETLAAIIDDCRKFCETPAYASVRDCEGSWAIASKATVEHAGRDFWYTRNGHGCGFWDGDWPEPYATSLTDASKAFRSLDAYLGDDGKVYLS